MSTPLCGETTGAVMHALGAEIITTSLSLLESDDTELLISMMFGRLWYIEEVLLNGI